MLWVTLIYRAFIIPLCFQETMNHGHTLGLFKNFYSFTWQLTCIHTRNLQRSPSRSFLSRRHPRRNGSSNWKVVCWFFNTDRRRLQALHETPKTQSSMNRNFCYLH